MEDETETAVVIEARKIAAQMLQPSIEAWKRKVSELEAQVEDLKLQVEDWKERIDELCNMAWEKVYPGRTDWEYPSQAVRHLVQYCGELQEENKRKFADGYALGKRDAELVNEK